MMYDALLTQLRSRLSLRSGFGVGTAIAAVCWGAFVDPVVLPAEMQPVVAVFAFALVLWLTEAVPYVVSSVLAVVLLVQLDAAPSFRVAASGFASSLVCFLLLVFLLGIAIDRVDLDAWVASRTLSRETRHPFRSLTVQLFALAFVMPSAVARATTFAPVVDELTDAYGLDDEGGFSNAAFLLLGHTNPIGSLALMTGGGMALVAAEVLHTAGYALTWLDWALLMAPPVTTLYALSAATAYRLYGGIADDVTTTVERDGAAGTIQSLTHEQRVVGAVLVGAVSLWLGGSLVGLPAIVPAALAVTALALPGVEILTAADTAEVSWGILFVVGAMFSLLDRLEEAGAFQYGVNTVLRVAPLDALAHWEVVATLLVFAAAVRIVFSTGSAALLVVLPVIMRLGGSLGVAQVPLALATVLVVAATTVFPFNTTAVLVAMAHGPLDRRDVLSFGLLTLVNALVVVALAWTIYWPSALTLVRG